MIKLGILGSTRGTNLQTLIEAIESHKLKASIEVVISNKADAFILQRGSAKGIPSIFLSKQDLNREEYDQKITDLLESYKVDLIVLIGYMRILSEAFVSFWQNKIINVHPSLLPAFAGKMDQSVHQAVLDAKIQETGCTIHYVTSEVDAGPILLQKSCPVLEHDTADSLKTRVQALEGQALIEVIECFTH